MLFIILSNETAKNFVGSAVTAVNDILNFGQGVISGINGVVNTFEDLLGQLSQTIIAVEGLETPLENSRNLLNNQQSQLNIAEGYCTQTIDTNSVIQGLNNQLNTYPQLTNIPSGSNISTIGYSDQATVELSQASLKDSVTQINSMINQIQTASNAGLNTLNQSSAAITNALTTTTNAINGYFNFLNETLQNYGFGYQARQGIANDIYLGENVFTAIACVFCAIPALLLCWVIPAVLINKQPLDCCMKLLACYVFSCIWIYFLFAAITLMLSIAIGQACTNTPMMISKLDAQISALVDIPLPYFVSGIGYISISEGVNGSINCQGNGTYLQAFGLNVETLNVTQEFLNITNYFENTISSFNFQTVTNNTIVYLDKYLSQLQSAPPNQLEMIQTYVDGIYGVQQQLNNQSNFGIYQGQIDINLEEINNQSAIIGGVYFTENNVTLLNSTQSPYSQNQTFFHDKKNITLTLIAEKQQGLTEIQNINSTCQSILLAAQNMTYSVNLTLVILNQLQQLPNETKVQVASTTLFLGYVESNITAIASDIHQLIDSTFAVINYIFSCATFGAFYQQDVNQDVCTDIFTYLVLGCIASFFTGIFLFLLYPVLLEATKRVGYPETEIIRPTPKGWQPSNSQNTQTTTTTYHTTVYMTMPGQEQSPPMQTTPGFGQPQPQPQPDGGFVTGNNKDVPLMMQPMVQQMPQQQPLVNTQQQWEPPQPTQEQPQPIYPSVQPTTSGKVGEVDFEAEIYGKGI